MHQQNQQPWHGRIESLLSDILLHSSVEVMLMLLLMWRHERHHQHHYFGGPQNYAAEIPTGQLGGN